MEKPNQKLCYRTRNDLSFALAATKFNGVRSNVELNGNSTLKHTRILCERCTVRWTKYVVVVRTANYIRWQKMMPYRSTISLFIVLCCYCCCDNLQNFRFFHSLFSPSHRFFILSFMFGANHSICIPIASFVSQINHARCVNTSTLSRSQSYNRAIINLIKSKLCNCKIL